MLIISSHMMDKKDALHTLREEPIEKLVEIADAEGLPRQDIRTKDELVMRLAKTQFSIK
jgi:hypothetical protein